MNDRSCRSQAEVRRHYMKLYGMIFNSLIFQDLFVNIKLQREYKSKLINTINACNWGKLQNCYALKQCYSMAGIKHARIHYVVSEGVQIWQQFFFLSVFIWWEDPNTTISGTTSARQWNAIEMAFRWRANNGPMNAGLVALWFSGDPEQYC